MEEIPQEKRSVILKTLALLDAKLDTYAQHPLWAAREKDEPVEVDVYAADVERAGMDRLTFAQGLQYLEDANHVAISGVYDPADADIVDTPDGAFIHASNLDSLLFQVLVPDDIVPIIEKYQH